MMLSLTVGVAGFEPTTPCSQSRCANRTALHPESLFEVVFSIAMQIYAFFSNMQNILAFFYLIFAFTLKKHYIHPYNDFNTI